MPAVAGAGVVHTWVRV
jgi:hypothetical protein